MVISTLMVILPNNPYRNINIMSNDTIIGIR